MTNLEDLLVDKKCFYFNSIDRFIVNISALSIVFIDIILFPKFFVNKIRYIL